MPEEPAIFPTPPPATALPEREVRKRGALQVYEALREDILWMAIDPGAVLDEMALAARFGVSRTPIREALLLLSGEGLVKFLANRTSIVAPLHLNNLAQYLDTYGVLSRAMIRSVARALPRDAAYEVAHMQAQVSDLYRSGSAMPALRADLALRRRLAALAGNEFQEQYFNHVLDAGVRTKIRHLFPNARPDDLDGFAGDIQAIAQTVIAGRPDAADAALRRMIGREAEVILRSLSPQGVDDFSFLSISIRVEPQT